MRRASHLELRTVLVLTMACAAAMLLSAAMPRDPEPRPGSGEASVSFKSAGLFTTADATLEVETEPGAHVHVSVNGGDYMTLDRVAGRSLASLVRTERYAPTAMQWRHPLPELPRAVVATAFARKAGSSGPMRMATYLFQSHGDLPVISIVSDEPGLYGSEDGLLVPGDFLLRAPLALRESYARDPRWWKYPGNYHGRGREWERPAQVQFIEPDGRERFQVPAGVRISGEMTRGFPQHALRLEFDAPLSQPLFPSDPGGARSVVLRAAGNDQVKGMLRDAYQHELCDGQGFITSRSVPCVAYINGEYQGLRYIRQRMDDRELSRLFGAPRKRFTILEDKNELYRGDSADALAFLRLMSRTERWDAKDPAWIDTLEARVDVDGFLRYMASQMILGNMDWPRQNVKYWRYTGTPKTGPLDGRWRFIMGDSDLGFGANAAVQTDLFVKVRDAHVPISRLFLALMRNTAMKERFIRHAQELLDGPLSAERCLRVLEDRARLIRPEMARHLARWRKPADAQAWEAEVEVMRAYARQREAVVREQLLALQTN